MKNKEFRDLLAIVTMRERPREKHMLEVQTTDVSKVSRSFPLQ